MPELPEMENYKLQLTSKIVGKTIDKVNIERPKSLNEPVDQFVKHATGRKITSIERRAKYLLFYLDSGKVLLLHLMLGGKLFYGTDEESPDRTKQVTLTMENKSLFFIGLRLGYLHILDPIEVQQELNHLGPEPLDTTFTLYVFNKELRQKRTTIKNVLLDQDVIAGIGNRYSDEICFEAECSPERKISELDETTIRKVFQAIKTVLQEAVAKGGYMDQPLFEGDQRTGGYLPQFKVHGREGEKCPRCGETIAMEKMGSRKVYFCPNCQH